MGCNSVRLFAKEGPGLHTETMRMTIGQIVDESRESPEEDVAELGDSIYCVTHRDISPAIEAAWHEVIHRRIADLESGRVGGIPLEEAVARARAIVALACEN
jgi:Putative addiction module component